MQISMKGLADDRPHRVQLKTTTGLSAMRLSTLAATAASSNEPAWSFAMPAHGINDVMHACCVGSGDTSPLVEGNFAADQARVLKIAFLHSIGWRKVGDCDGHPVDEPLRE